MANAVPPEATMYSAWPNSTGGDPAGGGDVKAELFEKTSRAQQERVTRIIKLDPAGG